MTLATLDSRASVQVFIRVDNTNLPPLLAMFDGMKVAYFLSGLIIIAGFIIRLGQTADVWRNLTIAFYETNQMIVERVFIMIFRLVWY